MDRRQQILVTAGDLFREYGYHATSMREIAKSLEIRGSSLYAHIDSKEEMLWEIVSRAAEAFLDRALALEPNLAPKDKLSALIRGHFEVIMQELPNATVFFQEWKFLPADLKTRVIGLRDTYEKQFRDVVEEGVRAGQFHVENSKLATLFILSSLNWSYQWLDLEGPLSLDEIATHYSHLSLAALNYREDVHYDS